MKRLIVITCIFFLANLSPSRFLGQTTENFVIPMGTRIELILETNLNSDTNRQGDRFTAKVTKSINLNGEEVIPKGTIVEGRVAKVNQSKGIIKESKINLSYERFIFPNGVSETVVASQVELENNNRNQQGHKEKILKRGVSLKRDLSPIGTGATVGVGIEAIVEKNKKRIQMSSGTRMVIQMDRPLTLSFTKSD